MRLRKFHRLFGLVLFLFLINASVTGVLRSNAKWVYWKDRPPKALKTTISQPAFPIEKVFETAKTLFPQGTNLQRVELRSFLEKPVYLIRADGKGLSPVMLDADTGTKISPIDSQTAERVALTFADEQTRIISNEKVESYKARKSGEPRPVFKIAFNDPARTEVYIDRDTGDVLNLMDRGRRFGMWIVKLHELDFAGMSRVALGILGGSIVLLSITGLCLAVQTRRKMPKTNKSS